MPNVRVDQEVYEDLVRFAAKLQMELGKPVSVAEAIRELLKHLEVEPG